MKIEFNNLIPIPLKNKQFSKDSLWNKHYSWESPSKIVLKAVSGTGKSSFVDYLTGVRHDYLGQISINSKCIKEFCENEWSDFRTMKIATVYQDLQLFDNLSVIENIEVKNDLTKHFSIQKIEQLIDRVGLNEVKYKKSNTLSFGQKQRVAILRSLAQPFKLLVMDEPFSHLDLANQEVILGIILEELEFNHAGFILTTLGEMPKCKIDNVINL